MIVLWPLPSLAHWVSAYMPPRHEVSSEQRTAVRTRVVLNEAYGYEHVEPLTRRDLVALL